MVVTKDQLLDFGNVTVIDRNVNMIIRYKLQLTGHQCDQKLSVGDQNFKTGRQQATTLLSPQHLKFHVKWVFFKENIKLPWTIFVNEATIL